MKLSWCILFQLLMYSLIGKKWVCCIFLLVSIFFCHKINKIRYRHFLCLIQLLQWAFERFRLIPISILKKEHYYLGLKKGHFKISIEKLFTLLNCLFSRKFLSLINENIMYRLGLLCISLGHTPIKMFCHSCPLSLVN